MATLRGGEKLAEKLREIAQLVAKPATLRVGFLEGASYSNGTSVAMVAAINEWGAPSRGQPPRPFFRTMIAAKQKEWPTAIAGLLKANNYNAAEALELTGQAIAGQLRQAIVDFEGAPLAPSTIKRKHSDKALVDTGQMLASVDFEVKT